MRADRLVAILLLLQSRGQVTASEVAEMLHLHVNTVKRLGDRGELKYYKVCKRGDRRFLLEDVRRFLDNNR